MALLGQGNQQTSMAGAFQNGMGGNYGQFGMQTQGMGMYGAYGMGGMGGMPSVGMSPPMLSMPMGFGGGFSYNPTSRNSIGLEFGDKATAALMGKLDKNMSAEEMTNFIKGLNDPSGWDMALEGVQGACALGQLGLQYWAMGESISMQKEYMAAQERIANTVIASYDKSMEIRERMYNTGVDLQRDLIKAELELSKFRIEKSAEVATHTIDVAANTGYLNNQFYGTPQNSFLI